MNEGNLEENTRHDNLDIWICLQRWSFRFQSSVQNQSETGLGGWVSGPKERGRGRVNRWTMWCLNYYFWKFFFITCWEWVFLERRKSCLLVSPFTRRSLNRTHGYFEVSVPNYSLMSSRPTLTWHECWKADTTFMTPEMDRALSY